MKTIVGIIIGFLLYCAFILFIAPVFIAPAKAQGLSQYGLWEDDPVAIEQWNYEIFPIAPMIINPGPKVAVVPEEPEIVDYPNNETPGTIVIVQKLRKLYYVIDADSALEYPIGVGRDGFQWTGVEKVSRIVDWPEWIPPPEMRARRPELPVRMAGGVKNPLGAVAIYLGNTLYRIHGSNEPKTIGTESSSGCFRMHNEHAVHLASLVHVGTVVKVY
jgi:lipoprotein-anchoring transpeptidase ErfK/SrfK